MKTHSDFVQLKVRNFYAEQRQSTVEAHEDRIGHVTDKKLGDGCETEAGQVTRTVNTQRS